MKLLLTIFIFSAAFINTLNAQIIQEQPQIDPLACPNYQYKCPSCNNETEICVYPNSGGCLGAGIPTCQSSLCEDVFCITERQPCPDDCPFSCKYNGPPCCPFTGEPVCEPTCAIKCNITPCPEDCVDNCHYPDADICCPRSGQVVCNSQAFSFTTKTMFFGDQYKKPGKSHVDYGYAYSAQLESLALEEAGSKAAEEAASYAATVMFSVDQQQMMTSDYDYLSEFAAIYDGYSAEYGYQSEYVTAVYDGFHHGEDYFPQYGYPYPDGSYENYGYNPYAAYDPRYPAPPPPSTKQHHHYVGDDDYFDGLFIGGPEFNNRGRPPQKCPSCIKTVTEVDISISFVTTTRSTGDIVCAQYIIPCPSECPYSCIYPMDQPCPYTEQPWCPYENEGPDCIYNTEGYEFPYFPPYDPYHSVFTSILNESGVTSTPAFVTEIATALPVHYCPLIFRYCPIECPTSCLRPDVPCPFAAEGYCPGSSPTTTISPSALETATLSTFVGYHLVCPLYILACPYCPDGYLCTRDSTGNCPNTNVPYCISGIATAPPLEPTISLPAPFFQYVEASPSSTQIYSRSYPAVDAPSESNHWNFGFGYHPYNNKFAQAADSHKKKEEEDVCTRSGLTKIHSKIVFDQLQKRRVGCEEACEMLEWDEECDNTCIYQTETTCCIQTICLPKN